jgi:hypothetical protein
MTIQSPGRRLRLLILSLSLFCCGIANAQTTSPPAGPPGISVVETTWKKIRLFNLALPPTIAPPVVSDTGMVKPPNDNSDLRRTGGGEVPPEVRTKAINDDIGKDFSYYLFIKVKNTSPKKILSVAYDFVFTDPGTKEELKRYSRRGFQTIGTNETKWLRSMSLEGPPRQVTLAGLQKNERSPFDERAEIKCVLFSDGTGWKAPDADQKTCDELVKYTMNPRRTRIRDQSPDDQ